MANNLDSCISSGIYGTLRLYPPSFIIPTNSNESQQIYVTFIPSSTYYQSPQDIVAIIELRDKDENLIPGIRTILTDQEKINYQYIQLDDSRFQITILATRILQGANINFSFRFSVPQTRQEYLCATVNVDALSSGFGFVYNYFKVESSVGQNITTADQVPVSTEIEEIVKPQKQVFVEKILNANPYYTFYIENYENYMLFTDPAARVGNLNSEIVNENLLPNLNVMALLNINNNNIIKASANENPLTSGKFGDFSSTNNNPIISLSSFGGLIDGRKSIDFPSNAKTDEIDNKMSYFEELSEDVLNIYNNLENGKLVVASSFYQAPKTFLFNSQYEKILYPKINSIKNLFPMYSHVFVDNELVRNAQTNALSSLKQENYMKYMESIDKSRFFSDSTIKNKFNKYLENSELLDYFYYCLTSFVSLTNEDIYLTSTTFPLTDESNLFVNIFFGDLSDDTSSRYRNIKHVFYIGDFDYIEQGSYSNNFKNSKLKNLLKDPKFVEEFLTDQILFYRIDKWRTDDPNLETIRQIEQEEEVFSENNELRPLQSYYIINNFENTFLELLDSQVKFQKEYEYRLYKYFSFVETIENAAGTFTYVKIKKQLVDTVKTFINDDPPVVPDVQILPYKNNDTEFVMIFSSNSGRYFDYPIAITDTDNEEIKKLLPFSSRNKEGQIQFEGDDLIKSYQLMRLETEPKSYSDFSNSQITDIETPENGVIGHVETVQPNKKYYYIARSIDVHNKFSNPTSVMEIELINESGTIYLKKNIIDFNEIKYNFTKELDKYLQIKPSTKHLTPNIGEENSAFEMNTVSMGPENNKVWDKNFMLRLTSKTTGKKIDVKFKFTYGMRN